MKSPIVETLRINAKAAPLWASIMGAAADELERLQSFGSCEAREKEVSVLPDTYIVELFEGAEIGLPAGSSIETKRAALRASLEGVSSGLWVSGSVFVLLIYGGLVNEKKVDGRHQKRLTLLGKIFLDENK